MMLGHSAASGSAALDLPAWALAYAVFAVLVVVILISRSRHVPRARPRQSAHTTGPVAAPAGSARPGKVAGVLQIVTAIGFWAFVAFCWFGPSTLTQNIATLTLVGMLWSLGGWAALACGWCWEALDPFTVFARRRDRADSPHPVAPWWAPIPVFATYVVVWIAWIAGDEPRHFAIWLTLYGVAMVAVARRGGPDALRAWNPLPATMDLTAPITRPARAHARTGEKTERSRIALVAAMLLGAVGANQIASTEWFSTTVSDDAGFTETAAVMVAFALVTTGIVAVWRGGERLVEAARRAPGTRPVAAALGPVAGAVWLAQATSIGLTQTQNVLVLISDPFAQGWNLFGTVYWEVSYEPLSPLVLGLVQAGVILAGHVAALSMIGHAATERSPDGSTSAAARNRAWNAGLGAMGSIVVSGVVWTLVLLG